MGMFITFLVFGLPILFLFWALCSMAVGGSLLGGFILMAIIITVSTVFALASSGKDPEYLKEVQEKNNRFYAQSRNFYGRKFSTNNGDIILLFKTNNYNEMTGTITRHCIKNGVGHTIYFSQIQSCVLSDKNGIVKSCSVSEPSILNQSVEFNKFRLRINICDDFFEFKSDEFYVLDQIYKTTEYIITKGKSMETSPFSEVSI